MKFIVIGMFAFFTLVILKIVSDALGENGRRDLIAAIRPYLFRLAIATVIVTALIALAFSGAFIRLL